MIFVSVGQMMPFDRLIRFMDEWAGSNPAQEIVAQIGAGNYRPSHLRAVDFLASGEFRSCIERADAVVSHAGTGNIMAALEQRKRVLIFPRSKKLQEVTNDHQMATARHFQQQGQVRVALDAAELESELDLLLTRPQPEALAPFASEALIGRLRQFLFSAS